MWTPRFGLTNGQIRRIQALYSTYKEVQSHTQVPWQMIAAVHYRERGLRTGVSNPFQFDPEPTYQTLLNWLTDYSDLTPWQCEHYARQGVDDFTTAATTAGCFLQHKVLNKLTLNPDDNLVKQAFWRYNGTVGHKPEDSSYVMNGFSDEYYPMQTPGGTINGHRVEPTKDEEAGAFTVYKQLRVLFP